MDFDVEALPQESGEKLLLATVVPRPIAWITTRAPDGTHNAAPYSFFNVMGVDPPIVVMGIQGHAERRLKDTGRNIADTGEFVVNLVSADVAEAMNITAINAPPDEDELKIAGLTTAASVKIKPPRIASAPVAFECRVETTLSFAPNQSIVIGRVVHIHVRDDCVLDRERCYIDTPKLGLVGRMHGAGWYARTTDLFQMQRPTWNAPSKP
jgi:flavin reductase (DIM6/NTAB) family NADH-FMN oxidoreductase RutF